MGLADCGETKTDRYYCINNSLVITSDITFIVPFSMICDRQPNNNRSWQQRKQVMADPPPAAPSHLPDWNVVVDAQHRISGSVNYGHGAARKKSRRDHRPLCSSKEDRQRGRGGSKRQKCRRTTIREPLAKCEGSPATSWALLCNPSYFVWTSQPAATAALQGHWFQAHNERQIIPDWMKKTVKKKIMLTE